MIEMHFPIRFGIYSKNFDSSLFGILFKMSQTALSRSENSSFILRSRVFVEPQTSSMGFRSGICAGHGINWMPLRVFHSSPAWERKLYIVANQLASQFGEKMNLCFFQNVDIVPTNSFLASFDKAHHVIASNGTPKAKRPTSPDPLPTVTA